MVDLGDGPEFDDTEERLELAEERLRHVRRAILAASYFDEAEVGDDLAPRVTELVGYLRGACGDPADKRKIAELELELDRMTTERNAAISELESLSNSMILGPEDR